MNFVNPRLLNPEILSNGSYSSPTGNSFQASTQSAPYATQLDQNEKSKTLGGGGRVINRNYLQIQAENYHNRASSLTGQNQVRGRLGTSQHDINAYGNGYEEPKRTRSISRSVRNLFNSTKSKRDKSYDSSSVHNANSTNYDVNSGKWLIFLISIDECFLTNEPLIALVDKKNYYQKDCSNT